jgi:hypothetical protein
MKREQAKKRIRVFFEGMDWLFQIQNLNKKIEWMKEDDGEKCAEVIYNEDYQRITIKIYPCFFEEELEDQRKALLHELCHTITIPMHKLTIEFMQGKAVTEETVRHAHERATSQIENILDGLLQGKLYYGKEAYAKYLKGKKKK